jgi:hypothetical protein
MPFTTTLARYVREVVEEARSGLDTLCIQLLSLHQTSEEAFVKLFDTSQMSVAGFVETLQLRYQILNGATPQEHLNGR